MHILELDPIVMIKERVEDETRVHISLWKTCKMLEYVLEEKLEHVQEEYLYANILILQFFTLEAFLNFLGENLRPNIWKKERDYFYRKSICGKRGTLGKFWYLADELGCKEYFETGKGKKVYEFVEQDLKGIRDFFAHAKPEILHDERYRSPHKSPDFVENFIDQNIDIKNVKKGFQYVEELILKLHDKANELEKYDRHIKNPLTGPDRVLRGQTINE